MSLLEYIQYAWAPVVIFLWSEIKELRKKLDEKASHTDLAKYLEPRMQKVDAALEHTNKSIQSLDQKTHELLLMIVEWRAQQNDKK